MVQASLIFMTCVPMTGLYHAPCSGEIDNAGCVNLPVRSYQISTACEWTLYSARISGVVRGVTDDSNLATLFARLQDEKILLPEENFYGESRSHT